MEISIITPVYKAEKYLRRCVDSILKQTYTDFELILVDDGSPDQSGAICDQYAEKDDRVRVIHQNNGGAAAARNTGLDAASGEWIAFIDSDDWVHPEYLWVLYETAVKQHSDLVVCRYQTVYDDTVVENSPAEPTLSSEDKEDFWLGDRTGAVVPWGKLYRRVLFDGIRYPVGRTAEDEYVTYKLLFGCEHLTVLDNILYRYYVNTGSVSRSDYLKRLPDALDAFKQHEAFFNNSPWKKVYRLEVEYYAAAWSDAIWITKKRKDKDSKQLTMKLRTELREYMKTHKQMIPFEKRKDIYISAYPSQEWFIRGFGFLKGKLKHE